MKTNFLDYIFSTISILVLVTGSFLCTFAAYKTVFIYFDNFSSITTILFFVFVYGFSTPFFLRIIRLTFPFKTGSYSMNHGQFALWKLHAVLSQLGQPCLGLFIPIFLRPLVYVLYGASIGKQTAIGGKILDPFATRLDDRAVLGEGSIVTAHIITHDRFCLLPVTVKKWATVGVGVIIMPGVEVGENSVVLPGSVVTMKTQIPPNEVWGGIPAKKIKDVDKSNVRS